MSYETIEDALAVVIIKIDGYSTANCIGNDYRVLATGQTQAVILKRGPSQRDQLSMGSSPLYRNFWTVNAELYVPFTDEAVNLATSIRDEAQKIIDEVAKWPNLDSTSGVQDVQIPNVSEPEEYLIGVGRWWRQVLSVSVEELETVTLSE